MEVLGKRNEVLGNKSWGREGKSLERDLWGCELIKNNVQLVRDYFFLKKLIT